MNDCLSVGCMPCDNCIKELRRLEEIELNSDAICDVNDELRKHIAELKKENKELKVNVV